MWKLLGLYQRKFEGIAKYSNMGIKFDIHYNNQLGMKNDLNYKN
jgi:hypothetical protein